MLEPTFDTIVILLEVACSLPVSVNLMRYFSSAQSSSAFPLPFLPKAANKHTNFNHAWVAT